MEKELTATAPLKLQLDERIHLRATAPLKLQLYELAAFWHTTPSDLIREKISDGYDELLQMKAEAEEDSKLSDLQLLTKLATAEL